LLPVMNFKSLSYIFLGF